MSDAVAIIKAANFASLKHKSQRRKDPEKTPYINHPLGVAFILTNAGVTDIATLQAAILHDTVEDTDTTFEELAEEFGEEVCGIVREVTDDKGLPKEQRKRLQVIHAPTASHKAKLVKLADKLHNLTDLLRVSPEGWSDKRTSEYFQWANEVVFGLRGTNAILEASLDSVFMQKGMKVQHPFQQ